MRKLLAILTILSVSAFAQINNGGGGGVGGGVAVQVNGSATGLSTTANFVPNPFSNYSGWALGAFGTNINVNGSFPQNANIYVFGDSTATLTTQSGDSSAPNGFLGRAGYTGELFSNAGNGVTQGWAVSGDQWEDVSIRVWAHISDWWLASNSSGQLQAATVLMTPGINNANFKGNNTYRTTITRPTIYAAMTGAMLTASNFTFGQAAGCVKTGTWTTDNATFLNASSPVDTVSGVVEVSNTNNDTIACPITTTSNSPVGIIIYGMKDSNAGTFTLTSGAGACTDVVTGGTTLNAFGGASIATNNGAAVTIGAALCPLTAGAYTMTAKVTSATNAANKVWIFGMGALPAFPGHRSTVAPMVAGGVLRARTDTNSAQTDLYDTENMNACARLSATYNFPCQFVPLHTYTVATLPGSPLTGAIADISDASTATSCATGSGTNVVRCRYNGATWDAQIGGVTPISMPTASGFYTDGLHPARALHALIYEQIAPFFPARVSNFTTGVGFVPDNGQSATTGSTVPTVCFTVATGTVAAGELALGDCNAQGNANVGLDLRTGILRHYTDDLYANNGNTTDIDQQRGRNFFLMAGCSGCRIGWTNSTTQGTASEDTTIDRAAAGVVGVSTTSAGNHDGVFSSKGFISPNVVHQTAKTAAITTSTLCASATAGCNVAGQYHISATIINTGTACTNITAGSVGLNLTWTDSNGTTHTTVTVPLFTQASSTATAATMPFVANNLSAFASADFNISTNGTIIQYATTYVACTTGTGTYQLDISINKVQ